VQDAKGLTLWYYLHAQQQDCASLTLW